MFCEMSDSLPFVPGVTRVEGSAVEADRSAVSLLVDSAGEKGTPSRLLLVTPQIVRGTSADRVSCPTGAIKRAGFLRLKRDTQPLRAALVRLALQITVYLKGKQQQRLSGRQTQHVTVNQHAHVGDKIQNQQMPMVSRANLRIGNPMLKKQQKIARRRKNSVRQPDKKILRYADPARARKKIARRQCRCRCWSITVFGP